MAGLRSCNARIRAKGRSPHMRAKKLASLTKSVRIYDQAAPTAVGQTLVVTSVSGDECVAGWGNPGAITTTADALTDNSTGTAGSTIAAGAGVSTLTIPL